MSIPPWYRPKKRFLAEALLTLDLSRTTGIGPLEPGLSIMWDMTPILCASDPSHRVRVTVGAEAQTLTVKRRRQHIATLRLRRDTQRIGAPLRAVCPSCEHLAYRLYLAHGWFRCGNCLRVTYASGQRDQRDRALVRIQRLEHRLDCTEHLSRHRGRRQISTEIERQDMRLNASMPASLLRRLTQKMEDGD